MGGHELLEAVVSAGCDALLGMYRNPSMLRALGERGRQCVIDRYSRRSQAESYLDVLKAATEEFHQKRSRTRLAFAAGSE